MGLTLIDPTQLKVPGGGAGGSAAGLLASDYDWERSPSGSVAIGANTVTLTNVPLGVYGTPPNGNAHYVRLAGSAAALSMAVTGANLATPIVVTVASTAGLVTGNYVEIVGALGNLSINGGWYITVLSGTTLSLNNSYGNETGNGAWTSGGTLTMGPEVVRITGGTANGDLAGGTLQFTAANAHASGYTIASATGGIQEAGNAAGSRGTVLVDGLVDFYGPANFQNSISIKGSGVAGAVIRKSYGGSNLTISSDFGNLITAGPLFPNLKAAGEDEFSIDGIKFIQNSAFAMGGEQRTYAGCAFMINARCRQTVSITNVAFDGVRAGINLDSCLEVVVANVTGINLGSYGLSLGNNYSESTTIFITNASFQTSLPVVDLMYIAEVYNTSKLHINGLTLTGWGSGGTTGRGLVLRCQFIGYSVSDISVSNFKISGSAVGIGIYGANTAVGQRFKFSNGSASGANAVLLSLDGVCTLQNMEFADVNFYSETASDAAVFLSPGFTNITFDSCKFFASASSTSALLNTTGAFTGLTVRNCQIGFAEDGSTSGNVGYIGIYFQGNAVNGTNVVLENNSIYASNIGIAQYANLVGLVFSGNNLSGGGWLADTGRTITGKIMVSADNLFDSTGTPVVIASAASIALHAVILNATISGTTGIGTVTGLWEGRSGIMLTPDGTVTFTAGATIGNTFTSTQLRPFRYFVTGSKIYLG